MSEKLSEIKAQDVEPVMVTIGVSTFLSGEIGAIATRPISCDAIIGGTQIDPIEEKLCPWSEYNNFDDATKQWIDKYCLGTPNGFIIIGNPNYWPAVWTMNHHCDGNIGFDEYNNFIAIKDIAAGEELTYDYGLGEANPNFRMKCECGSDNCRGTITGNDWQKLRLGKMVSYMLFDLR